MSLDLQPHKKHEGAKILLARWSWASGRRHPTMATAGLAGGGPRPALQSPEIEWERINKSRFFVMGTGVFSGITTCLFPLSVIKTRMMTLESQGGGGNVGVRATVKAVRSVVSQEGVLGLYRGFPTVVTGFLPARLVYLSTLESVKSRLKKFLAANTQLEQTRVVAVSSFFSGACASLASQTIFVPVDVVSQQQMVSQNRVRVGDKVRAILRNEGFHGFYRGYWMSVGLFVPGSAMWWGSYSMYKEQYWKLLAPSQGEGTGGASPSDESLRALQGGWRLVGVQAVSAVSAGCTTSLVTTPLDVIKTRYQVSCRSSQAGTEAQRTTAYKEVTNLFRKEGLWGFYRGLFPRMTASSLWGTSMILAYEFLKRNCVVTEEYVD